MFNSIFFRCFLFAMISIFSTTSKAQLEVSPQISWKTLTTPRFEIIFNAKQQELAFLYAEKLEKAYFALHGYFHSFPEKTVVVINDKTDITNGYATRIPYPHIMAYPVLPGPEDSLGDTGDWAFELLAHEYTHIINFEPISGVMKPLRATFGNIIAPNLLLPQWWKEGLAVHMETLLSHHGRLRSYFQDATIRAMVQDQSFLSHDIAEVNEQIPSWPKGMRPYLFGSLMWSQIHAEKGDSIAGTLNERYGKQIPYFIESPARELLGDDYSQIYERMLNDTAARAEQQIKALQKKPLTPVIIPQNTFASVTAPAISPDGQHLALITEDDSNSRAVKIVTKENPEKSFLESKSAETIENFNQSLSISNHTDGPPTGSIQRVSWFPDSEKIVFDKIDSVNRYERYSDLYIYDLKTKQNLTLTRGLRGREPSVSPDGKAIVFVKLEGGRTHLAVLNAPFVDQTDKVLFSGALQERISYPLFWDQDAILFSMRKIDGSENLYRYSLSTSAVEKILPSFENIRFAKKTSEGLLFTSGKNGVLNLYLASKDLKNARPVSHTLSAFFSADIDPIRKEIFATSMTGQGPKVVAILSQDWQNTPQELPVIPSLMADRYPQKTNHEGAEAEAKAALQQSQVEDYSASGYLWPQYWFPFFATSSNSNGLIFMAQTSGFDPLKKHSYTLMGSWDTQINRGGMEGTYLNQVTSLPFGLGVFNRSTYLGSIHNQLNDFGVSASALPNMFWVSKYTSSQIGWEYLERSTATTAVKRTGPYAILRHSTFSMSGAQISPENGGGFYLGATNYLPQEGYLDHAKFIAGGQIYFSKFLPKHHVLMLKANGLHIPKLIPSIYGAATESYVFTPDNHLPEYILRGYLRGQIYGRNLATVNLEYRLPLCDLYKGSRTDPLFFRRLSGAIVADGAAADGRFVSDAGLAESINMKRFFTSAGAEIKLETTIGYILPVNFVLGYYVAFNTPTGASGTVGTTLQISGF